MMVVQANMELWIKEHQRWLEDGEVGERLRVANETLVSLSFEDMDMSNVIFFKCDLVNCDFTRVNLEGARFIECQISEGMFDECDLTGAMFDDNLLVTVKFIDCNLTDSNFQNSKLISCDFDRSRLVRTNFLNAFMDNVEFPEVYAEDVKHFSLFHWEGVGHNAQPLVFDVSKDTLWFSTFKGTLVEFKNYLFSLRDNSGTLEVLKRIVVILELYKVEKNVNIAM